MQVFDPALNQLLMHPDWETWSKRMLPRYHYDVNDAKLAAETHAAWFAELKAKRAAEAAAKAAEQEAAAKAAVTVVQQGEHESTRTAEAAPNKLACCIQ